MERVIGWVGEGIKDEIIADEARDNGVIECADEAEGLRFRARFNLHNFVPSEREDGGRFCFPGGAGGEGELQRGVVTGIAQNLTTSARGRAVVRWRRGDFQYLRPQIGGRRGALGG